MGRIKDLATEAFSNASDDFEDLDGATSGSRKIRPVNKIGGFVNSRDKLDTISFDGATAGARAYWPVSGLGAGKITVPIIVTVPQANPTATKVLWWTSSSLLTYTSTAAWAMRMAILTTGAVDLRLADAANANSRTLTVTSNLVASFPGQKVFIHVSWDGLTAPVIYVNGIAQATTETTAGSAPAWSTVLDDGYFGIGSINASGNLPGSILPFGPINAVLTASEIFMHAQTGILPPWCEVGTGSMIQTINGTDNADFNGGTIGSWGQTNAPLSNVGNKLQAVTSAVFAFVRLGNSFAPTVNGWKYRLIFDLTVDIGTVNVSEPNGTNNYAIGLNTGVGQSVEFIANSTVGGIAFRPSNSGATITLDNIKLIPLGPAFKPVIQPIPVLADSGSNKIAGVLTAGVTPITDKRDWVIQALTNTSGNQQILGASVFFDFLKVVLDDWWINNGGTSKTVSLGNVSAGAQYQSAGTFAAGRVKATLLTQVPATNNLWVNSNGTDALRHTIRGYLVD